MPLLVPSFRAAFSKEEFFGVLRSVSGIANDSVIDAEPPVLTPKLQERVNADPVRGHLMDYSPISQRVIFQKKDSETK